VATGVSGYPSKRIVFVRVAGHPFGVWRWRRNRNVGFVARVGPLGHVQVQFYRCKFFGSGERDGRRGRHGVDLHCWGVKGRRRKRGVGVHVVL
jgi:hypothetical protein